MGFPLKTGGSLDPEPDYQSSFRDEWLRKARNDLVSARILLAHGDPVTDTACFHNYDKKPLSAASA
jgi:hypothetical protein